MLTVTSTTTGLLDYARVAVGTTSPWGGAGLRDQFTVSGRMYSTWRHLECDSPGTDIISAQSANTASQCGPFAFIEDGDGNMSVSAGYPSSLLIQGGSTGSVGVGEGASLRSVNVFVSGTTSPVIEAWVGVPSLASQTTGSYLVGFTSTTTDTYGPFTDGVFFQASTTQWSAVAVKDSVATQVNTGIATTTAPVYQKMRIEFDANTAYFLIDGAVVAQISTNLPVVTLSSVAGVAVLSGTIKQGMHVSLMRVWVDDPAGDIVQEAFSAPPKSDDGIIPGEYPIAAQFSSSETAGDLVPGSVVVYDVSPPTGSSDIFIKLAGKKESRTVAGVVAHPRTGGLNFGGSGTLDVAVGGTARIRVSAKNGPIARGDFLAPSEMPGIAVKAVSSGMVIARALAPYDGAADGEKILAEIRPQFMEITAEEDVPQTFAGGMLAAASEISDALANLGQTITKTVFGKVSAAFASIGNLFTRTITIVPDGEIVVPEGLNQISGSGVILAGQTQVVIPNTKVKPENKILVTPTALTSAQLAVVAKTPGQSFTVGIAGLAESDITFDWLIISSYQTGETQTMVSVPQDPVSDSVEPSAPPSEPPAPPVQEPDEPLPPVDEPPPAEEPQAPPVTEEPPVGNPPADQDPPSDNPADVGDPTVPPVDLPDGNDAENPLP